jgi:LL-diaminopimelate aminotransferase
MKLYSDYRVLPSLRLVDMPPYAFGQLDELKMEVAAEGTELIDLSLGSPDRPTHPTVLKALYEGMQKLRNQQYPIFSGLPAFKERICEWFSSRFGVTLDPATHVLPLIGSKEGIGHLAFAYIQEGDITITPSPYYPVHMRATTLSGGHVYELPLKPENQYVGDLDAIPEDVLIRAKIMILSYPHNPTGASVNKAYLKKAVDLCKKYNIILLNDLAYSEIWFDDHKACSVLEVEGAMDVAIEFHTFSKTYNMAGMRLGFACGNPEIIQTLYKLKTNLDYGVCMGIQEAGIAAINLGDDYREEIRLEYQRRRDYLVPRLRNIGFKPMNPKGAMYVWVPINVASLEFATQLLKETGVSVVPGVTFGANGEGHIRIAMVQNVQALERACDGIEAFCKSHPLAL